MEPSADITITGRGFYSILAETPKACTWMRNAIDGFDGEIAYSDDSRMTQDIADAAVAEGLAVFVNERQYLGQNQVAVTNGN